MDLSIIIVSYKVKDLLGRCLRSIFASQGQTIEVIVVDNASNDGTGEMIKKDFPQVKFIENKINLGFAKACNQGITQARGKNFLFLNPDTEVKQGTLKGVIEYFGKNPQCGIVGGKILNPDGTIQPSVRRFPRLSDQFLQHFFVLDFDYSKEQEVDQVKGAFMAVRREVIEKIGNFDEGFFLWFEEVDLCKRAKDAGFKVCYTPSITAIHQGAASFNQMRPVTRKLIWNRSLSYYFKKHKPLWQWFVIQLIRPIGLCISFVSGFFS